ncbi:MAG: hypothetical protein HYR95_02360, partial [Candidatus Colwellbacteria bacterium]|nr:hypothetical protein [Candidatus Colwellbacteria bacterium]
MAKKVKKKEIDFDEVVSDSVSGDLGSKELPLKKHPFNAVFTVSLAIASVVLLRTFILGGAEH